MEQQKTTFAYWIVAKRSCSWPLPTACCLVIDLLRGRRILFSVLWYWQEPCETTQKRGLYSTIWKKPWIPCACLFCPSNLSEDVCVGIAGLLPSLFCGSALLLFSFWQPGTTWALLLFQSGPAFFFSGLLVCFFRIDCLPHPLNSIFHDYLSCWFLNVVTVCSAGNGDVGTVVTSVWPWVLSIEKSPENFSWYWVNPLGTDPTKPLITS